MIGAIHERNLLGRLVAGQAPSDFVFWLPGTECPEDMKKTLMSLAKDVYSQTWAHKHKIGELKEGVRFEPMKLC